MLGSPPRARGAHIGGVQAASGSPPRARGARVAAPDGAARHRITPRARGAHRAQARQAIMAGITPASAGSTWCWGSMAARRQDHPRARGAPGVVEVRVGDVGITPASAGSTRCHGPTGRSRRDHPRERGEHGQVPEVEGPLHRITPASAGSTRRAGGTRTWSWDHPRERGEHRSRRGSAGRAAGSPPRARGARSCPFLRCGLTRITPASAGSTAADWGDGWCRTDHPRERGEHNSSDLAVVSWLGSPPRARGAPGRVVRGRRRVGITPASAGSTRGCRYGGVLGRDHPRERGEHQATEFYDAASQGSPPRARGARRIHGAGGAGIRITPASAGSTAGQPVRRVRDRDHPRERGEHRPPFTPEQIEEGSPPRARGARAQPNPEAAEGRITPASAGSTPPRSNTSRDTPDHPRERGEHLMYERVVLARRGITPASAGSTTCIGALSLM